MRPFFIYKKKKKNFPKLFRVLNFIIIIECMRLNNKLQNKVWVFLLMLGLAVSTVSAQTNLEEARGQWYKEASEQLYQLEQECPRQQARIVKIKEKLQKLFKVTVESVPGYSFTRVSSNTSRGRVYSKDDWKEFYASTRGKRNGTLKQELQEQIKNNKFLVYSDSRKHIFLNVEKFGGYVECLYTGRIWEGKGMPNSNNFNIEHSWPQSKGAKGIAKGDLHHLFPTDSKANSTRGSLPFGEITSSKWAQGGSKCDGRHFDVKKKSRGNIARALFYFSTRYNMKIDDDQENTLKKWHKEDPVDANERARNDRVEEIQGNRNPFIDHPEYVSQISDF